MEIFFRNSCCGIPATTVTANGAATDARIQQQQQLFNHLQLKFESEKPNSTQAEMAVNELQQFESTHHAALNEVRKCIQERDLLGLSFKKVQEKLQVLEQSAALNQQQQKLEQQIQHIDRQQTEVSSN